MDDTIKHQSGRCVCGVLNFHTLNDPQRITICHCLWCQRRTGTAFGTEVVYLQGNLVFSDTIILSKYRHYSDEFKDKLTKCGVCANKIDLRSNEELMRA